MINSWYLTPRNFDVHTGRNINLQKQNKEKKSETNLTADVLKEDQNKLNIRNDCLFFSNQTLNNVQMFKEFPLRHANKHIYIACYSNNGDQEEEENLTRDFTDGLTMPGLPILFGKRKK